MKGWLMALSLLLTLTGCGMRTGTDTTPGTDTVPDTTVTQWQDTTGDTAPRSVTEAQERYYAAQDGRVRDTTGNDTLTDDVRRAADTTADAAREVGDGLDSGAERMADGVRDAADRMTADTGAANTGNAGTATVKR